MSKLKVKKAISDVMHKENQSVRIEKGKAKIVEDKYWKAHSDDLERRIIKQQP